jgi:hypothetical protein
LPRENPKPCSSKQKKTNKKKTDKKHPAKKLKKRKNEMERKAI